MIGVDTTFLIDILRNIPAAAAKAVQLDMEIEVLTTEANVYEVVSGSPKLTDPDRAIHDLDVLLSRLVVLPLDRKSSIRAGMISNDLQKKGKMIDDVDCLTAGILMANGCNTIVTRNVKHFKRIPGLQVVSY